VLDAFDSLCKTWAWEPCASSAFILHYIERAPRIKIGAYDENGTYFERTLDNMAARMALHEMDHMDGVLFTRRIPNCDHAVPLSGFSCMSDWSDDFPSLEARSTFLYTTFTPPHTFATDSSVRDAQLLDAVFDHGIYPGCQFDEEHRIEQAEWGRQQWGKERHAYSRDAATGERMPEVQKMILEDEDAVDSADENVANAVKAS
jgi:hypothetical protein